MKEDFLYYIWQHQLFKKSDLHTDSGLRLEVVKPGYRNLHNGPDFTEAHLKIDGIDWYGAVEMHVRASDWFRHGHQTDLNYETVVLHVVFENDKTIHLSDGTDIPALSVKGLFKPKVYDRYMNLMENPGKVPCAQQIGRVPVIKRMIMADRVLVERLKRKAEAIFQELELTQYDWQEVTFRKISEALGFKTNAEAMLDLARRVGLKSLLKVQQQDHKEALLLGIGGFLPETAPDGYVKQLTKEYQYQTKKFKIKHQMELSLWRFAPLRPYNYPTQRIVQLTALVHQYPNLWDRFLTTSDVKALKKQMAVQPGSYWQNHFRPGKESDKHIKGLSNAAIEHLLINVTAPMLAAYAQYTKEEKYMDRATQLLSGISKEQNRITKLWTGLNWQVSSAFDSQALNELFTQYCNKNRCLACAIGHHLIKADS